ncbi:hypothetical protein GCM10007092_17970 [Thermus composti]|uniref:Uncharacterized protein n=1 Tax=Thermus composti TaxID=532059 RepID=A0ABV6PZC6_9DEIN|nr:hypothetical protein [Thermus composti]GGN03875.1 hypothetical protein GCM10007092_17970 [Thermus composti]
MVWTLRANGYRVRLEPLAATTVMVLVAKRNLGHAPPSSPSGLDPAEENP